MHYLQNVPAAPADPFSVGPYLVVPSPLRGSSNTLYSILRDGKKVGEQVSYPDEAQCRDRERELAWANRARAEPKKPRFNNGAPPIRCKTCFIEKPRKDFYRAHASAFMVHCKRCVDSGLVENKGARR